MEKFDFCGWATKNDLKCSDGRIIRKDAFKHHDGATVPLVWNHDHNDPLRVLGKVVLQHRDEGVYAYGYFNETDLAKTARIYVEHGDIRHMSIWANQLQHQGNNVMHGTIREVSLVLAGANPGACIENVIKQDGMEVEDEARIWTGECIELYHGEDFEEMKEDYTENVENPESEEELENPESEEELEHADGETVADVLSTLNPKQEAVVYALLAKAADLDESDDEDEESEGGNGEMKHNAFENETGVTQKKVLSHADQEAIINLAKQSSVGSFKTACDIFAEERALQHGVFEDYDVLFPELELLKKGEPETL